MELKPKEMELKELMGLERGVVKENYERMWQKEEKKEDWGGKRLQG